MATDKKISELPVATAPTGAELIEIVQGGVNKQTTTQDVANISGALNVLDLATSSTAGATITFDLNSQVQRMFVGSASFATPKTIALSNATNALVFNFVLTLTDVAAVLTFPTTFTMVNYDTRWDDTAHTFTALVTGKYQFSATWDGTDWNLQLDGPYS